MESLIYHPQQLNQLNTILQKLPASGCLCAKADYVYLDIDDRFIHDIYPLIQNPHAEKPRYFDKDREYMGAHISIFYPEENIDIKPKDLGQIHSFSVKDCVMVDIWGKKYYALRVHSPTLVALRQQYGLGEKLIFKESLIDLHITVAVVPRFLY